MLLWSLCISPTGWRRALHISPPLILHACILPTQRVGSPSCKPSGRPRTCGLHCSHQTRTDRPKVGPQAHTTSHNQPLQLPGSLEVGEPCLAHCLAASKRGDQVPSFSLKIGLQLVPWARVAALLAEAFAGCSECLECLQCARQAALQPPAAAELLVSPAHADACSKANAPASASSTPGRCQCHTVAAVTARIQCSAQVETACSCGLCVSAPQAGGSRRICLRAPPQRPHQPPKHTAETTSLLSGNSSLHMLWWFSNLWGVLEETGAAKQSTCTSTFAGRLMKA